MIFIKHIIQRVRPAQQQTGEVPVEHPNFWMYQ